MLPNGAGDLADNVRALYQDRYVARESLSRVCVGLYSLAERLSQDQMSIDLFQSSNTCSIDIGNHNVPYYVATTKFPAEQTLSISTVDEN